MGGLASRRRSGGSGTLPLPIAKRHRGFWCRCVPHGGEAKKRHLLAQNACLHPPSCWQMGRDWGGGGMLHGILVPVHEGGVEVYGLANTNASKSTCAKLRAGGVAVALHTIPPHCNPKNCLCIVVRVLLWHLQHPTTE